MNVAQSRDDGDAFAAFPTGSTTVQLVLPGRIDLEAAARVAAYSFDTGLTIHAARIADELGQTDESQTRVLLTTDPMNGEAMTADAVRIQDLPGREGRSLDGLQS